MEGWVKLHRQLLGWEWWDDSHTVHLFIHLLLMANSHDRQWKGQTIKRGQLVTGRVRLSEATGISQQKIRTIIKRLKSTNEITTKSTNKNTIITICKFDQYQIKPTTKSTNRSTIHQPTINQPSTTNKKVKNIKNKENIIKGDFEFADDKFMQVWDEFRTMRRGIKKPMTDRAEQLAMAKINKLSGGQRLVAIEIVEQSIMNSWLGLFPVKDQQQSSRYNVGGGKNYKSKWQN